MEKQYQSNKIRLAALLERKNQNTCQNKAVHQALSASTSNKIIKFEDSDEEVSPVNKDILADVDDLEHNFLEKSHFLGKKGEKLMTVQSKIGSDDRFQLDDRFLSNSEDEVSDDQEEHELKAEKELMYSLMDSVLQTSGLTKRAYNTHSDGQHKVDDFVRFDPSDTTHDRYVVRNDEVTDEKCDKPEEIEAKSVDPSPIVDGDTYFEVNTDFNNVMAPSDSSNHGNGFQFNFAIEPAISNSPLESQSPENVVVRELQQDSSDDEMCIETVPVVNNVPKPQQQFFFYSLNPKYQQGNQVTFKRTQTMEEIENSWLQNRQNLTAEYKKRHKDAVRLQKKFSAKS